MINYKKTITNIHELLPELDLDTLFKITAVLGALAWMPQIIKWIVSWLGPIASELHFQINLGGKSQTESLVRIIVNKNRRA